MSAELLFVDGREALAAILVRPHETDPARITFEVHCNGIDKPAVILVLREVITLWEKDIAES